MTSIWPVDIDDVRQVLCHRASAYIVIGTRIDPDIDIENGWAYPSGQVDTVMRKYLDCTLGQQEGAKGARLVSQLYLQILRPIDESQPRIQPEHVQRYFVALAAVPPKQASLGYRKLSQAVQRLQQSHCDRIDCAMGQEKTSGPSC